MEDWWKTFADVLWPRTDPAWLLRTLLGAIAVAAMWRFWGAMERSLDLGESGGSETPHGPAEEWRRSEIVRLWTVDAAASASVVAPGTRLAVVDRGAVQFELTGAANPCKAWRRLMTKHAIGPSAIALQFPVAAVEVDHVVLGLLSQSGLPIDVVIQLHVGINTRQPRRLLASAPMRDDVVSVAEVQELVEDVARPWLEARVRALDAGALSGASAGTLAEELDQFLASRFFDANGLAGSVRWVGLQQAGEATVSG